MEGSGLVQQLKRLLPLLCLARAFEWMLAVSVRKGVGFRTIRALGLRLMCKINIRRHQPRQKQIHLHTYSNRLHGH